MGAQANQRLEKSNDQKTQSGESPDLSQIYVSYQNYRDKPTTETPSREKLSALELQRVNGVTSVEDSQKIDIQAARLAVLREACTREDVDKTVEQVEGEKVENASATSSNYRIKSKLLFGLHLTNFSLQSILAISHIVSGNGVWWLNVIAAACWGLCAVGQIEKVKPSQV